ncbi:hypothetical protein [Aquibacillus rhizosphaerae]|uniref:MFS transporter n=1 Tax=Aquibacillus rhizosphaerae TaxID=3051431 RepID=A0ABT7L368_9BACI|nr:hypothetical protein [Aquibacillus sp. LR5S19]MDL4840318.1 hypothetical protein [Aquibacillus sp. LR5S19]
MRVILESCRFVFIFLMLSIVLNFISFMILYPIFGEIAESYYGWTATIGAIVIMFFYIEKRVGERVI